MWVYTHTISLFLSLYIYMYVCTLYIHTCIYICGHWNAHFSEPLDSASQCAALCKEWDREAKLQLDFLFFVSMTPLSQYIGTDEMGAWTQLYFRDKIDKLKALFLYVVFRPSKG